MPEVHTPPPFCNKDKSNLLNVLPLNYSYSHICVVRLLYIITCIIILFIYIYIIYNIYIIYIYIYIYICVIYIPIDTYTIVLYKCTHYTYNAIL